MEGNRKYTGFYEAVFKCWPGACAVSGGETDRYIQINGFTVRLAFCSEVMARAIMPAFGHLECMPGIERDLTVYFGESMAGRVSIPPVPWKDGDQDIQGAIWTYDDETLMIISQPANKTLFFLDKINNTGIYWVHDASVIPYHDKASPLRLIFERWMRLRGCQIVHSGAVGFPDGGVLLAGKGGSGKSSTALKCLNSELFYAGDDYCMINDLDHPHVYSLYTSGKLNPGDTGLFPSLKPGLCNEDKLHEEKALYFFHHYFPNKMSAGFPLRAILVPEIVNRPGTTLRRVSPARGFLALAPTTIFQIPRAGQPEVNRFLDRFVRKLPNYILELGTDRDQAPAVITGFLKSGSHE
jgi:hypothetical protein